jgi:3',5'-cyclic AMP phosphodiesterase CpdA
MPAIAHLSDLHFGKIAHPDIVSALVEEVNALGVDLVAVSGDLTQRARRHQFEAAAQMLQAFDAPSLVVPGNHDVYAWWYPVHRLADPLRRYRRYITKDLLPAFETPGMSVLGLNSAYGSTVKGGRIGPQARQQVGSFFTAQATDTFKVLVVHHHLTRLPALGPHDVARHADKTLEAAREAGVHLLLCGHLHISHIEVLEGEPEQPPLVIASAGTSTSSRGRKQHRQANFYNHIRIADDHFTIEERRYDPARRQFDIVATTRFAR